MGTTTVSCSATDKTGNETEGTFEVTVLLRKTAPTVVATTPAGKNVARTANVTATFSEAMDEQSVEASRTVKLVKKGTTPVAAVVAYDPTTKKATLNPNKSLTAGRPTWRPCRPGRRTRRATRWRRTRPGASG